MQAITSFRFYRCIIVLSTICFVKIFSNEFAISRMASWYSM